MNKNPNEEITVDEFVQSYLILEEKIKINNTKYEKAIDELTEEKTRNKDSIQNMEDEIELNNGLTNKSKLYVTVIEGKDLISENFLSDCNAFVSLSFQDDMQETKIKKNTSNPAWYENFSFKITKPSGALRIEVFDNNLFGKKSIGFLSIDLTDLMDQKKRMQWYDLYNEKNNNCGKIFLKIQCIINFRHFYEGEIEKDEKYINIIKVAFDSTNNYVEQMKFPFGMLFVDNIENLLNDNQFHQADELIKILEKNKESIYLKRDNDYTERNSGLRATKVQKLTINTLTLVLMYCLIIFCFISLLERSDFINLIIAAITFYFFILHRNADIIKYFRYISCLIGLAIAMDLVWFISKFGSFFIGEKNDPEKSIKRIIYLISICGTIIKCFFIYALKNIKKKN